MAGDASTEWRDEDWVLVDRGRVVDDPGRFSAGGGGKSFYET